MRARLIALGGLAALCAALVGLAWGYVFPAGHQADTPYCRSLGRHRHLPFGQIVWW